MATVLSLAMKVTADASGLEQSLSPVDKALASLGTKATEVAGLFDKFLASTTGAGDAQAAVASQFQSLAEALANGDINAKQYAASFGAVKDSAEQLSRVFEAGARTTAQFATDQDKATTRIEALTEQLRLGAIEGPTFERALSDIAGVDLTNTDQGREFIDNLAASARLGAVDSKKAAAELVGLGDSGKQMSQALEKPTLKLNELSGIFAVLPGPIGEVAGRFSGLVSAGQGLQRIFEGGISTGFTGLAGSVTALLNPFTLAAAGVAAFGAAAVAIGSGLQQLSGRVEELQNTAARLGTSFEFAQVLEAAASRSGVAVDALAGALQKFSVNVAKAREGGNDAAEAFTQLGISQQELQTTDPSALAVRIADALGEIEDPATRAKLATDLLGKSGLELLPAFASIDDAAASIDKFRASISQVDVERLASLDDVFDDIGVALQGLGTQLLLPFTGLAAGVATAIENAISGITRFIDPILDSLTPVFDTLGSLIADFSESWADAAETTGEYIAAVIDVITRLATVIVEAVTQGTQYVADLVSSFEEMLGISGAVTGVTSAIAAAFSGLWDGIKVVVGAVGGFIEQVLQFAEDWLGIDRGINQATKAYEKQADVVSQTADAVAEKSKKEQEAAEKAIEANSKIIESLQDQLRIDTEFDGDSARLKAAKNVEAIEKEIQRTLDQIGAARKVGDQAAIQAGQQRLRDLDQLQAREQDIASGFAAERKKAAEEQKKIDEEQQKRADDLLKKLQDNQKKVYEAQHKAIEAAADLERKRIKQLTELRLGAIKLADLRTGAGADKFLDAVSGRQDPAIEEYRKQRRELEKLNKAVENLRVKQVEILRGTG